MGCCRCSVTRGTFGSSLADVTLERGDEEEAENSDCADVNVEELGIVAAAADDTEITTLDDVTGGGCGEVGDVTSRGCFWGRFGFNHCSLLLIAADEGFELLLLPDRERRGT